MKKRLVPGTKWRVKNHAYTPCHWTEEMMALRGKVFTIHRETTDGYITVSENHWKFTPCDFEPYVPGTDPNIDFLILEANGDLPEY
ncbi:MAG: hypothetical protein PVG39_25035 [Desulfobacteraceae bacterium]|jgi:hypothetical protein